MAGYDDRRVGEWFPAFLGGADGQGEGGGMVGVAVAGVRSAVGDAGGGGDALDAVEVFADHAAYGDAERAAVKLHAELAEDLDLERVGEGAELDFAVAMLVGVVLAELPDEEVAHAHAR